MTLAKRDILPPASALTFLVHRESAGYRFEVRHGDESLHEPAVAAVSERIAERRARAWISQYSREDDRGRCAMLGYHWSAVSRAIPGLRGGVQ